MRAIVGTSIVQSTVAALPSDEAVDDFVDSLSDMEALALLHDWSRWGRPEQLPPERGWRAWLMLAGRGSGKTRAGAEWVVDESLLVPGDRIALVGPTASDVRDVMVKGESGILACSPPWNLPNYEPSKRQLTWPSGAIATTYSAEEPDRLRGPQHTRAWADEVAAWRYGPETWSNLMFGLRLGENPCWMATTTPKPVRLVRELLEGEDVHVSRMTSYENAANLAPSFFSDIVKRYEGTRLGRQELLAELLEDVPGALWTRKRIDELRTRRVGDRYERPEMMRLVVAVDPAVTSGEEADETGIIVAGVGEDDVGYVLEDLSCRRSPDAWARVAVDAYYRWSADRIVAEVNNGGDLVEAVLRTVDDNISYKKVHASRGKRVRAEPVAALYEQGRVMHAGSFPDLEDQMTTYVPDQTDESPDRVDALVWAFTELIVSRRTTRIGTA